jgi:hypothetical protein
MLEATAFDAPSVAWHNMESALRPALVGQMNCRRAERRRQSRIVEKMKDVRREDLWRFIMTIAT